MEDFNDMRAELVKTGKLLLEEQLQRSKKRTMEDATTLDSQRVDVTEHMKSLLPVCPGCGNIPKTNEAVVSDRKVISSRYS